MNKYRGCILFPDGMFFSKAFQTKDEAELWICQENNNLERDSRVEILDEFNRVVDWYIYS